MPDSPAQPDAPPPARERVFYRDESAFREAMRRAVSRISRHQRGRESLRYAVLIALIVFQVILFGSDLAFDLELRRHIVPGVDMTRPLWLVLIVYVIGWTVWSRRRHRRIVAQRLCLECGTPLLTVTTDAHGDGRCPECQRDFNLGEYRPPSEQHGHAFAGYLDAKHFDLAMRRAADHLAEQSPLSIGTLLTWAWIALGTSFALQLIVGTGPLGALMEQLGAEPGHAILSAVLGLLTGAYSFSMRTLRASIAPEQRCFGCGYSLVHTPTDDDGVGRCPECAHEFARAEYVRPDDDATEAAPDERTARDETRR